MLRSIYMEARVRPYTTCKSKSGIVQHCSSRHLAYICLAQRTKKHHRVYLCNKPQSFDKSQTATRDLSARTINIHWALTEALPNSFNYKKKVQKFLGKHKKRGFIFENSVWLYRSVAAVLRRPYPLPQRARHSFRHTYKNIFLRLDNMHFLFLLVT